MAFLKDDAGAVTVDWVVLTAALVGLGLATMVVVSGGVEDVSTDIDTQLKNDHIIRTSFGCQNGEPGCTYFFPPPPEVDCTDAIAQGVQDCGVNFFPWLAGTYTTQSGEEFYVNADNVLIDHDTGDPLPLSMTVCLDNGQPCNAGTFDAAGREVDDNGVPIS